MEVNQRLLTELEAMGFPKARARKALFSGNQDIEAVIDWLVDHENDEASYEDLMVPINVATTETSAPFYISDEVNLRAQTLRNNAHRYTSEQKKNLDIERDKERIRAGRQQLEAKRVLHESETKRFVAQGHAEKEEEKIEKEKIHQKLHEDKLERKSVLRLPGDDSNSLHKKLTTENNRMGKCLRSLKRQNMEDETKSISAFQTLLIYVKNIVNNPNEKKFRKIRVSNPVFQERVGNFEEAIEFLELCGFEKVDGEKFLFLAREKVDMSVLKLAGTELQNALTNPFYGLLSR